MELLGAYNIMSTYTLTGAKKAREPKYLELIKFFIAHPNEEFSKSELFAKSGYNNRCRPGLNTCLMAILNSNGIIVYNKHTKKLGKGPNFDAYVSEYTNLLNTPQNLSNSDFSTEPILVAYQPNKNSKNKEFGTSKQELEARLAVVETQLVAIKEMLKKL